MRAVAGQRGATERTLAALAALVPEDLAALGAGRAVAGSAPPG
jgi:hypothetical protein